MNIRQFLLYCGIFLVLLGILGHVGVFGPSIEKSIFGKSWWFDNPENLAHFVLGVICLVSIYIVNSKMQRNLVFFIGVFATVAVFYNIGGKGMFFGSTLEYPLDLLLNLFISVWAIIVLIRTMKGTQ